DCLDFVGDDAALGDVMAGSDDALYQKRAGLVVLYVARVGNREHRDLERHELLRLVDSRHGYTLTQHDTCPGPPSSRKRPRPSLSSIPARAGMRKSDLITKARPRTSCRRPKSCPD